MKDVNIEIEDYFKQVMLLKKQFKLVKSACENQINQKKII